MSLWCMTEGYKYALYQPSDDFALMDRMVEMCKLGSANLLSLAALAMCKPDTCPCTYPLCTGQQSHPHGECPAMQRYLCHGITNRHDVMAEAQYILSTFPPHLSMTRLVCVAGCAPYPLRLESGEYSPAYGQRGSYSFATPSTGTIRARYGRAAWEAVHGDSSTQWRPMNDAAVVLQSIIHSTYIEDWDPIWAAPEPEVVMRQDPQLGTVYGVRYRLSQYIAPANPRVASNGARAGVGRK